MRRVASAMVAMAAVIGFCASPVGAITNGHADGDGHPYIGNLVADFVTPGYMQPVCSGTLVAPRIVVTSAHCLEPGMDPDRIWMSFDPVYHIADHTGGLGLYHGHMVTAVDPGGFVGQAGYAGQYGNSNGAFDIAVVHLDEAPPITPAKLPPAGLLSTLDLRGRTFTAVGYGVIRLDKTKGPNNFDENFDPDARFVATQEFRSLQEYLITLSQNPATGDGGWCYGDSGSADFVGDSDVMASVTSLIDAACRATGRGFRLDTALARGFLASQGVPLP